MAAKGYPGAYEKGCRDRGPRRAPTPDDVEVFHAGTARAADGRLLADGGRVLNVTALGATVAEAQQRAYAAVDRDRLAGRLLPPRHRLARGGTGGVTQILSAGRR